MIAGNFFKWKLFLQLYTKNENKPPRQRHMPTIGRIACGCSTTLNKIEPLLLKDARSIEQPKPIRVEKRGSDTQPVRAISESPILAKAIPVEMSGIAFPNPRKVSAKNSKGRLATIPTSSSRSTNKLASPQIQIIAIMNERNVNMIRLVGALVIWVVQ